MSLTDDLEIILITYNRKKHLQKTFDQIFAKDSPIKNFPITILDNKSDDGSSELIEEYKLKFPNITHIIHNHNIGGNANIARAYETASKKYVWVLCDDDYYDWSNWNEIQSAIESDKYDLIYTCTLLIRNNEDIAQLQHQATFVPGCIYATRRITDDVMQNIHNTVNTMFSQVMISADIICKTPDRIYIPSKDIVIRVLPEEENDNTIIRGRVEKDVHPDTKLVFWHIGFIKAIQIVNDKRKRDYIIQNVRFTDIFEQSFLQYMIFIIDYNHNNKNDSLKNLFNLFFEINLLQKLILIVAFFYYYVIGFFFLAYENQNGIYVRLFNKLKVRIYSRKWFKKNNKK